MQQELIEMLEETISYVEVWHKEDQDVLDKAEALVEKAKNNNVPAGPQGEQINKALGKLRAAQWCHPNEVERLIDEAIDALVAATPAPAQEAMQSFTVPDDLPGMWEHSDLTGGETDCAKPAQEVGLSKRQFDLICQAIDKADTITMEGDYMLDSDDCIAVVRVMQAMFDIAAHRAKDGT